MKPWLIFMALMIIGTPTMGQTNGVLSFRSYVDYNSKNDFSTELNQLSISHRDTDHLIYVSYNDDSTNVIVREAHVDFDFFGFDWEIGKIVSPFGFENLDRAEKSVFITHAKGNIEDYGLKLNHSYGILTTSGAYYGYGDFSIKSGVRFLKNKNTTLVSFNNYSKIDSTRGNWAISNIFLHESLLFDCSSLTEWYPDNGDFWSRLVVAPGIFDVIGIFGSYYNVKEMDGTLPTMSGEDTFTVGMFVDILASGTVSIEWEASKLFNPFLLLFTTTF